MGTQRLSNLSIMGVATFAVGCGGEADRWQDDGRGDHVDLNCEAELLAWFDEYAPADCEVGADCIGRVDASTMPDCGLVPGYAWHTAHATHIQASYRTRYEDAWSDLTLGEHKHADPNLEYQRFVDRVAPTDAERAAHERLLSVPHTNTGFDYQTWLANFSLLLDRAGKPLDLDSLGSNTDGRRVCGTPQDFEALNRQCGGNEPSLYINPGEAAMLSLMLETKPLGYDDDGVLSEWREQYISYLTEPQQLLFAFPSGLEPGLAAYEREFFGWARHARPPVRGERDSAEWLTFYLVFLEHNRLDDDHDRAQLELYEASAPLRLFGPVAYDTWLAGGLTDLGDFDGGYAALRDQPEKLARLLEVKPCAASADDLAGMQARFDELRDSRRWGSVDDAAPVACTENPSIRPRQTEATRRRSS